MNLVRYVRNVVFIAIDCLFIFPLTNFDKSSIYEYLLLLVFYNLYKSLNTSSSQS